MHAPMMKGIETDMPDDIKQFSNVEESRVRGMQTMAAIRAGLMKSEANSSKDQFYLSHENQVDLLEAWEDLITRAESPDATNSKIASLEQECDRLNQANMELNNSMRFTEGQCKSLHAENAKLLLSAQTFQETAKKFAQESEASFNSEMKTKQENKELRKELSVLRRALNAANGVIGHFTGRK